jgi:hypothetical protein
MTIPEFEPGRRGGKPTTNRLSYGAAWHSALITILPCAPYEDKDSELKDSNPSSNSIPS